MGETVEKIYCCDRDNNDNALAAAILANGRRDNDGWPMAAAMMNNGGWNQNQWMNNPFAYLMFLALFRNDGFGFAITQGFSATAFQAQQDKCDILRAGQDNTQRIIDTLNNHWKDEQALKIQDLKFELSQERQNNLINERFNRLGNCGCGWNNNCGCGNGCGC